MHSAPADLDKARQLIAASQRLVVFTGAGVSADSGVPTFRGSSGDSFWGKYDPMQLASPEGFHADPKLVYDWYSWRRSQLVQIQPNPAHLTIARWQKDKNATVITQNVDGLHERVAPPGANLLRVHGSLAEDRCSSCEFVEKLDFNHLPGLRHCPTCNAGLMRPAVVWFGEALDPDIWSAAELACRETDLLLVVGTSGEVWPAAGLVHSASLRADVIIVNLDEGGLDSCATVALHGRAAEILPLL